MKSIRDIRAETGLNQTDFWRRVGVQQSGGSRYESGRRIPKAVQLCLDIAYGAPVESKRAISKLKGQEK